MTAKFPVYWQMLVWNFQDQFSSWEVLYIASHLTVTDWPELYSKKSYCVSVLCMCRLIQYNPVSCFYDVQTSSMKDFILPTSESHTFALNIQITCDLLFKVKSLLCVNAPSNVLHTKYSQGSLWWAFLLL